MTNSLMHGVMKLACQAAPDSCSSQSHIQSLAFCLLANLAISRDCKGILQKVPLTMQIHPHSYTYIRIKTVTF